MKEYSKKNLAQRIIACALAVLMCVTCANSSAYSNFAGALFGSNESQNIVANAAGSVHPGNGTYYDCGTFTLKGSTSDGNGGQTTLTNGWDVSNVTTMIQADTAPTLANTTGLGTVDTNANIVCYSQYLGGLQKAYDDTHAGTIGNYTQVNNVYNSKDVTDYKAPAAPSTGLSYYYIAKGDSVRNNNGTTDTSDDYDEIKWTIYAWPMAAGNAISYSNQDGLKAEWDNIQADEALTGSDSEVANSVAVGSLKSIFGKSRPVWESGNLKYTDWLYGASLNDGTSDVAGIHDAVTDANAKNLLWSSSTMVNVSEHRPWLTMTVHYNNSVSKSADDIDGITIAEYPLGSTIPKGFDGNYRLALGTTGLADKGDAKNHIMISKSNNHQTPINFSAVEGGSTSVTYSPITVMSTLWSNAIHYNAAAVLRSNASEDYTYFKEATSSSATDGIDATGKNVNVQHGQKATEVSTLFSQADIDANTLVNTTYAYKYGDFTLDSARAQITANYTSGSKVTTYNTTGAPTGARLYAMYVTGSNSGAPVYARVFDWETAITSLQSANPAVNFDELLVNGGVGTINVTPVFDITYDYQRAAGTVSASVPASDPVLDTVATDKTTGMHTGIVSSNAQIQDIVTYSGCIVGHEYELNGQLYVVNSDNTTAIITGAKSTASFTATSADGFVGVNFTFNNTKYAGKTIVVYEELVDKTTGITVSTHNDATDEDQKVYYPSLTTKAVIPATGLQSSEPMDSITIQDTVTLTNLVVGENYKLEGKLADASTGSIVKNNGKDVSATLSFTADSTSASKVMKFEDVDLTGYSGKNVVIYQYLYLVNGSKSHVVFTANSRTDADETITLSNPTVSTVLAETGTDLKNIVPGNNIHVTDKVSYSDLAIGSGVDYVSVTKLMDADSGNPLKDANGNEIKGEESINDNASSTWEPEIDLVFDGSKLENVTAVAYNYLYRVIGGERYLVVSEEDKTNADQTIMFPTEPTLDTVATVTTGAGQTNKIALISTNVSITDKVEYFGLEVGKNYKLTATVFDKDTQSLVAGATATVDVKPTKMNDTINVVIPIDTSTLAGHTLVVYEVLTDGNTEVAKHDDANDADQTVRVATPSLDTVATGATTEDHTIPALTTTNIIDKVSYEGLSVGTTYTLTTKVYDKATGKLVASINPVTTTLKPQTSNGSVDVTIKVPSSTLVGKSLVVYEYLTLDGNEVATHADIDDEDQTVTVVTPVLTTKASDEETGKKKIGCTNKASIEDVVTYDKLEPNTSYSLTATIYDKSTGKQLKDIKAVTKTFTTGSEPSGEVTVSIPVDTTELAGKKLVVYEELKLGTVVIAKHADIDDDDQTVEVYSPSIDTEATSETTNDHTLPWSTAAVINDKVTYSNLTKGQAYTLTTEVYDKSTKKAISGIKATTTTFTPDEASGDITVSVTVDSSQYLGKSLVVYETLKIGNATIVKHHDIDDKDQTVTVVNPSISTVAVDSATGGHMMSLGKEAAIKDIVYYSGLANGSSYTLTSTVYDKSTGLQVSGIAAVTTTFTATGFSGSTQVTIPVDTTLYPGKTLVVYETLSLGGGKGGSTSGSSNNAGATSIKHEDINDANQTVFVGKISTVLMNAKKTSHNIGVSRSASCVDTITFSGLEPGRVYTVTGQLKNWDAVTGKVGVADTTKTNNNNTSSNTNSNSTSNKNTANNSNTSNSANNSNSNANNNANNGTTVNNTVNNANGVSPNAGSNSADSDEISVGTTNSGSNTTNGSTTKNSNDSTTTTTTNGNNTTNSGSNTNNSGSTDANATNGGSTTTTNSNNTTTNSGSNNNNTTANQNTNSNSTNNNNSSATQSTYVYGSNMAETVATTTITFIPTAPNGTVDVVFTVDTTALQNHKLVAFETVTDAHSGAVVMEHKDINDADQTVTVGNSSHNSVKTGVDDFTGIYVLIAIIALLCALGVSGFFAYRRKRD